MPMHARKTAMNDPAFRTQAQAWRLRWPPGLFVYVLLALSACQSAGTSLAQNGHTEAALLKKIDVAIGSAACNTDSQCRTIGIGARACGGPAAWRPWSTQTQTQASSDSLQALADQLATLQRSRQAQSGIASTCRYQPDPGSACVAQRCVLNKAPASDR